MNRAGTRAAAALGAALLLAATASACTTKGERCGENAACAPSPRTLRPGTWERMPSPPGGARQEVAAAVLEDTIFVAGGMTADGLATTRVESFDPAASAWSMEPALPVALHHAMAAALDGRLYVLGGFDLSGRASDRVFRLDGSRWLKAPNLKRPRAAGGAVAVGHTLIVVGGISSSKHVAEIEIFDGVRWRDGASMPKPLDHIGAATDGVELYVVGGRAGGQHVATAQVYDPRSNSWSRVRDMPTARSGLGATFFGDTLIAVGGEGLRIFPEVEAYDIDEKSWTPFPELEVPRHGVGVVVVGQTLFTLLGGDRVGRSPSAVSESMKLFPAVVPD
jgi:Kelch motif protein